MTATTGQSRPRFDLRASESDAALIRQAAFARHQTVTEFILQTAVAAAREVLSQDHTISVPGEIYDRVVAELAKSGEPVDELVELLKKPRQVKLTD